MSDPTDCTEQWGIYNRIRELRRSKGLSQEELARELGLNHRSVGYMERQDYEPSLRLAYKAADYFGVELDGVFYRREREQREPPPVGGDQPDSEAQLEDPSDETAGQLWQRPASLSILTALLDGYGADRERLARRTGLDAAALEAEMSSLKEEGLVKESVQPGPVFGRPHSTSFSLTGEGHRRIVEIHRNHLWREDE